jgi:hypothetical protein
MAFWSAAQQQRAPGPPPQQHFAAAGPSSNHNSFAPAQSQAAGLVAAATPQHFGAPAHAAAGGGSGDGRLRSVGELPACFRTVFPFRYFNAIQNECWPTIFESQINVVIAAPTGGGAHAAAPTCACLPPVPWRFNR